MSGAALMARSGSVSLEPFEQALAAYEAEVAAVRHEGLTRELPADAAERFFAVGFSLEQVHNNMADLQRVVAEWGPEPRNRKTSNSSASNSSGGPARVRRRSTG
jgi:hypothetical protein